MRLRSELNSPNTRDTQQLIKEKEDLHSILVERVAPSAMATSNAQHNLTFNMRGRTKLAAKTAFRDGNFSGVSEVKLGLQVRSKKHCG